MNKKNIIVGITVLILIGITATLLYTSRAFYEVSDSFNFINSRYYEQTVFDYDYTGSSQTFTAPYDGYYKVEAWGAKGIIGGDGSKGAYTSGTIYLTENETLYVYVGSMGKAGTAGIDATSTKGVGASAIFNGGGAGGTAGGGRFPYSDYSGGTSGGGATDIRLISGEWNNSTSLRSRIMVAGAGGGLGIYSVPDSVYSGHAGVFLGSRGYIASNVLSYSPELVLIAKAAAGYGGNHNIGGAIGTSDTSSILATPGIFGIGGNGSNSGTTDYCNGLSGGGGGYYGGGGAGNTSNACFVLGGGGGSSYISGYAGMNSVLETGGTVAQPIHANDTIHYSGKYFIDTVAKSGAEEMPNPDGGTMSGNFTNGKARISLLVNGKPEKTNNNLNNVRYIKDCVNGNNVTATNIWVELQAIVNGENVAYGKNIVGTSASKTEQPYSRIVDGDITALYKAATSQNTGLQCITVDLGQGYDLDEVSVWNYYMDNRTMNNHTLSVGATNTSGTTSLSTILINNQTGFQETSQGQRFSAWD